MPVLQKRFGAKLGPAAVFQYGGDQQGEGAGRGIEDQIGDRVRCLTRYRVQYLLRERRKAEHRGCFEANAKQRQRKCPDVVFKQDSFPKRLFIGFLRVMFHTF